MRLNTGNIETFRNFAAFYNTLMLEEESCGLLKLERKMNAVVVSAGNRCNYRLVAPGLDIMLNPEYRQMSRWSGG